VERGRQRLERMRPYAERHGLTMLQLACAWNLAHPAVNTVAPTLIQESGPGAHPIEEKRKELAALAAGTGGTDPRTRLSEEVVRSIRAIGDNTGSMALKGASPEHEGSPKPDRWGLDDDLSAVAARWDIDPAHALVKHEVNTVNR
jgi:hypothetical protein